MAEEDKQGGIGAARREKTKHVTDVQPAPAIDPAVAAAQPGPKNDRKGANGVDSVNPFEFDWTDSRGLRWTGSFVSEVLSIDQRAQVGLTRARMLNGVSPHLLDPETLNLLEMRAHLAVALRKAPEWMGKMGSFHDVNLLGSVYKEVADHERRFWGAEVEDPGQEDGEGS